MELKNISEKSLAALKKQGSQKSFVQVSKAMAKEFSAEAGKLNLIRTTYDQNLTMRTLLDQKTASSSVNQFSDESITQLSKDVLVATQAAQADAANGFAPSQGHRVFAYGLEQGSDDYMYKQLTQLIEQVKSLYPTTILEQTIIKYIEREVVHATSEGSLLEGKQSQYEGFVMFTSKEGKQSSSFNYCGFQLGGAHFNAQKTLLQTSGLEELIKQSVEQIHVKKVPEKFVGDVIVTPHCMQDFAEMWLSYISAGALLKNNSLFQNKKGQRVANEKWSLSSLPLSNHFATRSFWTADGYVSQNEEIFKNGILQNYLLGHYAATKLKEKNTLSEGHYLEMPAGTVELQQMIAQVKEGVLLARFSGGRPAENGDFSGVAKNSYYIKNGKIQYPLSETMVSGNLAKMLFDLKETSREVINFGYGQFPWVQFSNLVIS